MAKFVEKNRAAVLIALLVGAVFSALYLLLPVADLNQRSDYPEMGGLEAGLPAPLEYEYWMTKDPASGQVPAGIRMAELDHARGLGNDGSGSLIDWVEAGPDSLGGRTLTVALDVNDSQTVLAGASSGGVWKSTDQGETWRIVTRPNEHFSVTTIAQDPRSGQTDTWYMAGGEFRGSSGSLQNISTNYGLGVYKSVNNGETWDQLPGATAGDPAAFDTGFDYVTDIEISPTTGTVFLANNASGIYRSDDGGSSFPRVLGSSSAHSYTSVDIGSDGRVLATLSTLSLSGTQSSGGGVYESIDDGQTWTDVTPTTFPSSHQRSLVEIAPSNSDVAYVLTVVNRPNPGSIREDIRFHKLDLASGTSEDRSQNLPDFPGLASEGAQITTLNNFTMMLGVKPDDENFVVMGGTVPFRSRDGFATAFQTYRQAAIGGYECADSSCFDFQYATHYTEHWNDQHEVFFNPDNLDEMWSANDGGVYVTRDVTRAFVVWENKNRGYNVSQMFQVAISDEAGDGRILGGLQDHGVQYLNTEVESPESINDFSMGERAAFSDGAFVYLGGEHAIIGLANGRLHTLNYENDDNTDLENFFDYVQKFNAIPPDIRPPAAGGFKFYVHPTAFDPVDDKTFFYPDGSTSAIGATLYRNKDINTGSSNQVRQRWERLDNFALPFGYLYTAFGMSRHPAHRLYMGASASFSVPSTPRIFRVDHSNTSTDTPVDISIPNLPVGAFVHDIAVNPLNGNEILVVLSNYKIIGLYHSDDGGATYTAVEGNLEGANGSGPSLRAASILPLWEIGSVQRVYFVATSTGLYSTRELDGMDTIWEQEATDLIGGVVVDDVKSRPSDGRVVAGTHGRGIIVGTANPVLVGTERIDLPQGFSLGQNYPNPFVETTMIEYALNTPSRVSLTIFDSTGRRISSIVSNELKSSGTHVEEVDLSSITAGVYHYRLSIQPSGAEGDTYVATKSLTVLK